MKYGLYNKTKRAYSMLFIFRKGVKILDRIDVLLKNFVATFGGFCGYFLGGCDGSIDILENDS